MSPPPGEGAASSRLARWLPVGIAVVACAVGSWLRLRGAGSQFLWGDEHHSLDFWQRDLGEIFTSYDPNGSGIALPLLQHLLAGLLGPSLWAVRLPAAMGGLAGLLLMYPVLRRLVDPVVAALATLLLALNPAHIFFSHFARSYSLATCLCLCLLLAARRVTAQERPRTGWYALIAVTTALVPFVHLVSAAVVVAIAIGTVAVPLLSRRRPGALLAVCAAFGAGVLGAVALHLPAWQPFIDFVGSKVGQGTAVELGALDVASVLAGGRSAGAVCLLGLPAAAAWMLTRRGLHAALPVAAAMLPIPILVAANPLSGPYALARYLLPALPAMLAVLAWGWVELVRRLAGQPACTDRIALLGGGLLTILVFAFGPLGHSRHPDGPYASVFLGMRALPAFDVPFEETPALYRELAQRSDVNRIIEAPALPYAGLLLYRNYFLQHGIETWMGRVGRVANGVRGRPFVQLGDPNLACNSGADVLIFHRAPEAEVSRYWNTIYADGWQARTPAADRPFLVAFSWVRREQYAQLSRVEAHLQRTLGEPIHRDARISMWQLDRSHCPSAGQS